MTEPKPSADSQDMPLTCLSPAELSGWILPDAQWLAVEEWWHVSCLYELRSSSRVPALASPEVAAVLDEGDEAKIRDAAARLGFVKVSRGEIDAYGLTDAQLRTLQVQLGDFDPEFEFRILLGGGERIYPISVGLLLKLRTARRIFDSEES